MSHYILTDKKIVKTSDNRVMLLCKVADSSVTDYTGRYHSKHWAFCTFDECTDGFLHPKDAYEQRVKLFYEEEVQKLQDYYDKYEPGKTATEDSYVYAGTTYNGSGKLKALRSFYSARRTIPAEEFLINNILYLEFVSKDKKDDPCVHKNYKIGSELDLIDTHNRYVKMKKEKNQVYIIVDVIKIRRNTYERSDHYGF